MPKTTYILAVMLYSFFSYGQQITFHKNVNYRASALEQTLNKDGDVLFLESKTNHITKVEIFNDNYSESIVVNGNETTIDLKTLPYGNFVIQAKVDHQLIIMYLEKTEDLRLASSNKKQKSKTSKITVAHTNRKSTGVKDRLITEEIDKTTKDGIPAYYWVVEESNSNFGSSKTMRLEYKEDVDKLITKNKLELKSNISKKNKLVIYEVYNKSQFMNNQFRNPTYYKSADASKFLNIEPHYASNEEANGEFGP
jgi:hypothetical protein